MLALLLQLRRSRRWCRMEAQIVSQARTWFSRGRKEWWLFQSCKQFTFGALFPQDFPYLTSELGPTSLAVSVPSHSPCYCHGISHTRNHRFASYLRKEPLSFTSVGALSVWFMCRSLALRMMLDPYGLSAIY